MLHRRSFYSFSPPNLWRLANVTKLRHMVDSDPDLWNSVRHLGGPLPPEIWPTQNIRFRHDIGQLRDLIANISGSQQDIINRKKALQITDTQVQALNSVYFGPQTAKNGQGVLTHTSAIVHRTGVNKPVAFARGQHTHPTGGHHAGHWHAPSLQWNGLSVSEDFMILACVILTQCQRVTDGQTDILTVANTGLCRASYADT